MENIKELERAIRGSVIMPGDGDYDESRSIWNGMIVRKLGLIVRIRKGSRRLNHLGCGSGNACVRTHRDINFSGRS